MQTSPWHKAQRWATLTWPHCRRPHFWSCPLTPFERDPHWHTRPHCLPPHGPREAISQSCGPHTSSAGNSAAAKTKTGLFLLPIHENKPSLSFPAEGAGQWLREGTRSQGVCRASESRNPLKPQPSCPILSRSHLCYTQPPQTPTSPTHTLDNVRHQCEPSSGRVGSNDTPCYSPHEGMA